MSIRTQEDLIGLQRIGHVVSRTMRQLFAVIEIGMTTSELDSIGGQILASYGARSAPKLCYGFKGNVIISINEEVAHSIPGKRRIQDGDLVNIDVSAELDGYFADTGYTQPIGNAPETALKLCKASKEALDASLQTARAGQPVSGVENAIRSVARKHGFSVIENLAGHGVGRFIHEEPNHIPLYGAKRDKRVFEHGSVLTLEPFLSTGPTHAVEASDGWTLLTPKGNYNAQFEHTIVITDDAPIILTAA